jgi:type IV pilus assembly protein PilC
MEADSRSELIDKLRKMGFMTTGVEEAADAASAASFLAILRPIRSDDMILFYIQFANMINAGITILMSLSTLSRQLENARLRRTVSDIARQVEGGSGLSQGFAAYPAVFPKLFTSMIKAGEASGKLDTVLLRYAGFFERQEDLKQKIKSALFYPLILLCTGIAVMLLIVTFVIPQFVSIYKQSGVPLPLPTLVVYNVGMAIKNWWLAIIAVAVLAAFGLKYYFGTAAGAFFLDSMKLKLPLIGSIYRKGAVSRFARTLATLTGSGVPILESLDITADIMENEILRRVVVNARKAVEKGERLSEPFKVSEEFPPDVVQMITAGEETGNLDGMLNKIADFYDMTLDHTVKRLTMVIEPLFLVIMGCLIGVIMASMLMPIFDMVKTLKHSR